MALTSGFSDFHKMTITVLKTEYVKTDPLQINYRNYKKFNVTAFNEDLKNALFAHSDSTTNYHSFQTILKNVLDTHAPPRKKFARANDSPFMTKRLRKLIMNRLRCKNSYFKNKTVGNWEKYRKLRNECVKATKKAKTEYFANLNTKIIYDNKRFWKTMKSLFSDKKCKNQKIVLVETTNC